MNGIKKASHSHLERRAQADGKDVIRQGRTRFWRETFLTSSRASPHQIFNQFLIQGSRNGGSVLSGDLCAELTDARRRIIHLRLEIADGALRGGDCILLLVGFRIAPLRVLLHHHLLRGEVAFDLRRLRKPVMLSILSHLKHNEAY